MVGNVVFPTGTAIFNERLYIYYGAADKRIAAVSLNLHELLNELSGRASEDNPYCAITPTASLILAASKEGISLEKLAKAISKDEKITLMAIGWLLKEGKVYCNRTDNELIIKSR